MKGKRIKPPTGAVARTIEEISKARARRDDRLASATTVNGGNGARGPAEERERDKRR